MYGNNSLLKTIPFSGQVSAINGVMDSTLSDTQLNKELFNACRNGDVLKVKKLINSSNVNIRDTSGRKSTPLHFASGFGRKDIVEYLLHLNANVSAKDEGGLQPLHNACSFGQFCTFCQTFYSLPNILTVLIFYPLIDLSLIEF